MTSIALFQHRWDLLASPRARCLDMFYSSWPAWNNLVVELINRETNIHRCLRFVTFTHFNIQIHHPKFQRAFRVGLSIFSHHQIREFLHLRVKGVLLWKLSKSLCPGAPGFARQSFRKMQQGLLCQEWINNRWVWALPRSRIFVNIVGSTSYRNGINSLGLLIV